MINTIISGIYEMITYILLFVLTLFYFIDSEAQTGYQHLIWQIGACNHSASEFALAQNDYESFVPEGFGGATRYYVIGRSIPSKDWPYILPGPKDGFAGYSYWSGLWLHQLPI